MTELAMPATPISGGPQENAAGYPVCGYQNQEDLGYSATIVPDLDATYLLGESELAEVQVVDVAGFPAVEERLGADNSSPCKLAVSTADGQHLEIMAVARPGAFTPDQACDLTMKAAEFAVQTLQTLR